MTEASIHLAGIIILAVLGVIYLALTYVNKSILPAIGDFRKALAQQALDLQALKGDHALNQQEIKQNTARLNGQSQKIDNLLLAAPAPVSAATTSAAAPIVNTAEPAPSTEAPGEPATLLAPADGSKQSGGIVSDVINLVKGFGQTNLPADETAPTPDETLPAALAPAKVNVTVTADRALSADELAAAHAALDEQAKTGGSAQ